MKVIVVDIDGTIAKVHPERLKYIQRDKKDWDKFYELCFMDTPITPIIKLVEKLSEDHLIVFCTGRRESVREQTIKWINNETNLNGNFNLIMRSNGDLRKDTETKVEGLDSYIERNYQYISGIELILEDRNSMVKKWRELGYTCLQVAEGDF